MDVVVVTFVIGLLIALYLAIPLSGRRRRRRAGNAPPGGTTQTDPWVIPNAAPALKAGDGPATESNESPISQGIPEHLAPELPTGRSLLSERAFADDDSDHEIENSDEVTSPFDSIAATATVAPEDACDDGSSNANGALQHCRQRMPAAQPQFNTSSMEYERSSSSSSSHSVETRHEEFRGGDNTPPVRTDLDSAMRYAAPFNGAGGVVEDWSVRLETDPTATSVAWGGSNALMDWRTATQTCAEDASVTSGTLAICSDDPCSSCMVQSFPTDEWPLSPASMAGTRTAASRSGSGSISRYLHGGGDGVVAALDRSASGRPVPPAAPPPQGEGSGGCSASSIRCKPLASSFAQSVATEAVQPPPPLPPPPPPSFTRSNLSFWTSDGKVRHGGAGDLGSREADGSVTSGASNAGDFAAGVTRPPASQVSTPRDLPQPLDTPLLWYCHGTAGGGRGGRGRNNTVAASSKYSGGEGEKCAWPAEQSGTRSGVVWTPAMGLRKAAIRVPAPESPLTPAQSVQPLPAAWLQSSAGLPGESSLPYTKLPLPILPTPSPSPAFTQLPHSSQPTASVPSNHPSFLSYYAQTGIPAGGASPVREQTQSKRGARTPVPAAPQPDAAAQSSGHSSGFRATTNAAAAAWAAETACSRAAVLRTLPGGSEVLSDPVRSRSRTRSIGGVGGSVLLSEGPSETSAHATDTSLLLSDESKAHGLLPHCDNEMEHNEMRTMMGMRSGADRATAFLGLLVGMGGATSTLADEQGSEAAPAGAVDSSSMGDHSLEAMSVATSGGGGSGNGNGGAGVLHLSASSLGVGSTDAATVAASPFNGASASQGLDGAPLALNPAAAATRTPQAALCRAWGPQPCLHLGDLLKRPDRTPSLAGHASGHAAAAAAAVPAEPCGAAGVRSPASVLYTSRCSSKLLSVKFEGLADSTSSPETSTAAAAGAISRHVASTLLRHVPPGRLVRVSALAIRGCVQLLIQLQVGPPPQAAHSDVAAAATVAAHGIDLAVVLMSELSHLTAIEVAEQGQEPQQHEVLRSGVGSQRPTRPVTEEGSGGGGNGLGPRGVAAAAPPSPQTTSSGITLSMELQGSGAVPLLRRAFTSCTGPATPTAPGNPQLACHALDARSGGAAVAAEAAASALPMGRLTSAADGQAPAGPTELASPCSGGRGGGGGGGRSGGFRRRSAAAVEQEAGMAAGGLTMLPQGWRELTAETSNAMPSVHITTVIPEPAVLAAQISAGPEGNEGEACNFRVRLALLCDAATSSGAGGSNGAIIVRVVAAAEEHVLLDDVYDTQGLPYIDLSLPARGLAGLAPGPLHIWLLSADPRTMKPSFSLMAGRTELLLLPPAAATELGDYIHLVLEGAEPHLEQGAPAIACGQTSEADAITRPGCANSPATGAAAAAPGAEPRGLTRSQLWSHHLQPLLVDFGCLLAAARELRAGWASPSKVWTSAAEGKAEEVEVAAAWRDLAADVLAHCEAAGLVACGEVLRGPITGGRDASEESGSDIIDLPQQDVVLCASEGIYPAAGAAATAPSLAGHQRPIVSPTDIGPHDSDPVGGGAGCAAHVAAAGVRAQLRPSQGNPLVPPPLPPKEQHGDFGTIPEGAAADTATAIHSDADTEEEDGGADQDLGDDSTGNPYGSPFSTNNAVEGGSSPGDPPAGYCTRTCTVLMRPLPRRRALRRTEGLLPRRYGSVHVAGGGGAAAVATTATVATAPGPATGVSNISALFTSAASRPPLPLAAQPVRTSIIHAAAGGSMYGTLPPKAASAATEVSQWGNDGIPVGHAASGLASGSDFEGCYLEPEHSGVHTGNTITDPLCATAGQMLSGLASTTADSDAAVSGGRRSLDGRRSFDGRGGGISAAAPCGRATAAVPILQPQPRSYGCFLPSASLLQEYGAVAATGGGPEEAMDFALTGGGGNGNSDEGLLKRGLGMDLFRTRRDDGGATAAAGTVAGPTSPMVRVLAAGYEEVEVEVLVTSLHPQGALTAAVTPSLSYEGGRTAARGERDIGMGAPQHHRHTIGSSDSPGRRRDVEAVHSSTKATLRHVELPPGAHAGLPVMALHCCLLLRDVDILQEVPSTHSQSASRQEAIPMPDPAEGGGQAGYGGEGEGAPSADQRAPGIDGGNEDDLDGLSQLVDLGYQEVQCGLLVRSLGRRTGGREETNNGAICPTAATPSSRTTSSLSTAAVDFPTDDNGREGDQPGAQEMQRTDRRLAAVRVGSSPVGSSASTSPSSPAARPSPAQPLIGGDSRALVSASLTAAAKALGYRDVTCTLLVKEDIVARGSVSSQSSIDACWLGMSSGDGTIDSQDASSGRPGCGGAASGIRDGSRHRHPTYHELRCGLLLKVLNRRRMDAADPVVGGS